jgi:hypothetical protein
MSAGSPTRGAGGADVGSDTDDLGAVVGCDLTGRLSNGGRVAGGDDQGGTLGGQRLGDARLRPRLAALTRATVPAS